MPIRTQTERIARSRENAMHLIIWLFEIDPQQREPFEAAYGADGEWAALFRRSPGYLGTSLFKDRAIPSRYLALDCWESREAFQRFMASHRLEYEALDERCRALTVREERLGTMETDPGRS